MTCGNPRCQHEFCWLCLHDRTRAAQDASFCTGRAEASHLEVLPCVERQIRSNWAQQAHDTRPAEDTYAKEVLQRFRVALTTRLESDAELLSAEDAGVPLRWRRLEFYDHSETRIRATAQVVFADVGDSHCAQQELIELLSWMRDRWWLRLSPEEVDAHNESFTDPQAFLELPCPERRRMHAERALICLEEHFGRQLVESERTRQEVGANRAEITSALEAVAANNAQLVAQGNVAFEQRDWALRQTVREEFNGYRAHIAVELQEDIAEVRDFFRGQFNEGARRVEQHARGHCEMFAAALREEAHRELISVDGSSAYRQARVQEELVRARHGEEQSAGLWRTERANAHAQAAAEQEAAVARCRFLAAAALDNARAHAENRCERIEEGFIRERDRAAVAELALADRGAQLREEQAMVSEFQDTALGMQAQVDEFVEQYAESTKCVIDRECSDVKKHVRDLVENAEALAMSSGPQGQTSAPGHELISANMSNKVCYKSCNLHKSTYSALQRDNCVCFDSHSGSPADPSLCDVNCPGNFSQFCGGDSWYTFHLMYLWVAPVEVICSGMPEPVGNHMPTYTTVCLDYFNKIVPCISTCPSGQHLASHEPVRDLLLRKCVVRQRCFEIECASVSHVAHAEVQSLCQEWTENSGCDIKCIEEYVIASHTSVERHYLDTVTYIRKSEYSLNGSCYGKKEFFSGCKSDGTYDVPHLTCQPINCILEDASTAKRIEFSGGYLLSSSPVERVLTND